MKPIQPKDLGDTLEVDPSTNKVETKHSPWVLGDDVAYVDLLFNGIVLVFRELNDYATPRGPQRPMVCTGIKYQGQWYGDSPNGESYVNPFG